MKGKDQSGPTMIGAIRPITPKLEEWLQQIPGTSEAAVQKSTVLGIATILTHFYSPSPKTLLTKKYIFNNCPD